MICRYCGKHAPKEHMNDVKKALVVLAYAVIKVVYTCAKCKEAIEKLPK